MSERTTSGHARPVLIAVEGIDRAGKTTQTARLAQRLTDRGRRVAVLSFPRYDSFFGRQIRLLLDGHGPASAATVDPQSMSLWYALDRWEAFSRLDPLAEVVLLNRYTLSNAVYQASRAAPDRADALFDWIIELEEGRLGLPRPELTAVLDVAPAVSRQRSQAGGRVEAPDVYERSSGLLTAARRRYLDAAGSLEGVILIGADDGHGGRAGIEDVHTRLLAEVDRALPQLAG